MAEASTDSANASPQTILGKPSDQPSSTPQTVKKPRRRNRSRALKKVKPALGNLPPTIVEEAKKKAASCLRLNKDATEFIPGGGDSSEVKGESTSRHKRRGGRIRNEVSRSDDGKSNSRKAFVSDDKNADANGQDRGNKPHRRNRKKASNPNPSNTDSTLPDSTHEKPPRRNRKKNNPNQDTPSSTQMEDSKPAFTPTTQTVKKNTPRRQKNNRSKQKFAWRSQIPQGSVDPISLESLHSLTYPPFALQISVPYQVVRTWPTPKDPSKHYHLFDGRVLAYYLVSQLQFIDPLNRRDLTREELLNLDSYLSRHNLGKAKVVEAFDNHGKGKLNSAGVAGQTERGRAELLQQEAQAILGAIFGGGGEADMAAGGVQQVRQRDVFRDDFEREYMSRPPAAAAPSETDEGILGDEEGGLRIIDDDINPGLRAGYHQQSGFADDSSGLDTALDTPYGNTVRYAQPRDSFPTLALPCAGEYTASNNFMHEPSQQTKNGMNKKPSSSLRSISKLISKTDPKQQARQRAAREDAQRRAALASLSFGQPIPASLTSTSAVPSLPSSITIINENSLGEKVERNRNFATALGITPSTIRDPRKGWSRPNSHDAFEAELTTTQYPDSLILNTKEVLLGQVIKLERKLNKFLVDDSSPSITLFPMARSLRKMVHEYCEFWDLSTESYDPEPRRYVHICKKRDTRAPYPLLSDVAKRPFVPQPLPPPPVQVMPDNVDLENVTERNFAQTDERNPLALLPRSLIVPEGAMFEFFEPTQRNDARNSAPGYATLPRPNLAERFQALGDGERQRLTLAPRTLPTELPPLQLKEGAEFGKVKRIREEQARRGREEKIKMEEKALVAAFASSDEEDQGSTSSSDWGEDEAEYQNDVFHDEDKEVELSSLLTKA